MDFNQAMNKAMTSPECYEKPKQEQKKPNTVSEGVSAIIEVLQEHGQKDRVTRNGSIKEKQWQ